ncbi:MAG: tetratricopeptide repeat protein [Hamadaea sp.]|uniref:AfsR/SARP family transcriptional regulator n=1 Tax=Hamadaea sp. TaxID=2024425 RepID=UPI001829A5B7|nr:BTAD domain-containing putative transcriptional regulator [Hamadaea sp.]NUT21818.1 tetratricopeptide repeat protein [Hamadaea sp.]
MYFTVLGPVGVAVDGKDLTISRAQRRAVLAYLLLHAGTPVGVERIVRALWGEHPPSTAKTQVQVAVSSIRSLLRAAGADPITSGPAGYLLTVGPDDLDLAAFRDGVNRAAANLPRHRQAELLRTALGLWGPPPLGGITGDFVTAARESLIDERLSVAERLFDLELELGRHHEIVTELGALCDEHPLRERLIGQLMIALNRSGQRAEALARYRATRARLVEEVGIEPGAHLQSVHRELLGESGRQVPATRVVPSQLPPIPATFVGRQEQLETIAAQLTQPAALVVIRGLGGLGKTSLAVTAAAQAAPAHPDGCLFIDLRGTDAEAAQPHTVLGGFLRAMGVPAAEVPHDPAERLGLYRTLTSGRHLLVVLDNAQGEAQVRPLLPSGSGNATIVTSRRTLPALDGAYHVDLPLFDADDGLALLRTILGTDVAASDESVQELLDVCGGLPLAVRVLAARLLDDRALTPAALVRALRQTGTPLAEMSAGDLAVAASLQVSVDRLDSDAARLLAHFGRAQQPSHTPWSASTLLGVPAEPALAELAKVHLINETAGRVSLHDLVQEYAATLPGDDDGFQRLVDAYLDMAYQSSILLSAGRSLTHYVSDAESPYAQRFATRAEAVQWLNRESENLVATVVHLARLDRHTETWQLAYHLRFFFRATHRVDEQETVLKLALEAAITLADGVSEARVREALSSYLGAVQRHDEQLAELRQVLALCERIGDRVGLGRCHVSIGAALGSQGRPEEAIAHHRSALSIPEYADNPQNGAVAHVNIGTCLGELGRHEEAIRELEYARRIAADAGDTNILCFIHHNLAEVHLRLGDYDNAAVHARSEVVTAQQGRDTDREARGWEILGDALVHSDRAAAAKAWEQAIGLYEAQGKAGFAEALRARIG